jgi:ABC-type transport system involved in cytochrome c biogenesis permease subunit
LLIGLHQGTAAIYLAAALAAALGLALPSPRSRRISVARLALGAVVHALAVFGLHRLRPTPSLTTLPAALSLMALLLVLFFLALQWRTRLGALGVLVPIVAFLADFWAAIFVPRGTPGLAPPGALWSHMHILMASAGLAAFAIAGLAGGLFLVEHRRLKRKRPHRGRAGASLEALDRVNRVTLAVGFPLLTLGVLTGVLWVNAATGALWPGTAHANWTAMAWVIYAGLVVARFGAHQGARASAINAMGGSLFLLFAVLGVGALS